MKKPVDFWGRHGNRLRLWISQRQLSWARLAASALHERPLGVAVSLFLEKILEESFALRVNPVETAQLELVSDDMTALTAAHGNVGTVVRPPQQ